jgi:hypothetical protein
VGQEPRELRSLPGVSGQDAQVPCFAEKKDRAVVMLMCGMKDCEPSLHEGGAGSRGEIGVIYFVR